MNGSKFILTFKYVHICSCSVNFYSLRSSALIKSISSESTLYDDSVTGLSSLKLWSIFSGLHKIVCNGTVTDPKNLFSSYLIYFPSCILVYIYLSNNEIKIWVEEFANSSFVNPDPFSDSSLNYKTSFHLGMAPSSTFVLLVIDFYGW